MHIEVLTKGKINMDYTVLILMILSGALFFGMFFLFVNLGDKI